jgi:cytochrome b-561
MTLAFVVFMSEALLSYQAPLVPGIPRERRKQVHYGLHAAAVVCALGGLAAVYCSHIWKAPDPMPDCR